MSLFTELQLAVLEILPDIGDIIIEREEEDHLHVVWGNNTPFLSGWELMYNSIIIRLKPDTIPNQAKAIKQKINKHRVKQLLKGIIK